ncbi:efflux RND transporter periplasmic adaptor subunit [Alkaliphilus sp. MSJ-5]|uniref:Efflux RND transporter periplasmic adaptor subunit n=1 Tax=Alkaliphilus flagellatus TaxID=2841507 RepID=A0ABS6G571_9FIRM|nr:efflux RND transporter periplasmic adaptor subunit [Alkaliphilus flagellatus]MBU5676516.1 efflux RND transporter periplasmic adaptor subunit [Alkaliphilus flagellatus]
MTKKKKIISIAIIVTIIGVSGFYISTGSRAVDVSTAAVIEGDIAKYVEELGVIKVKNQVNIYAPTAGMVTEVLVDIGDQVKKGDILVKLDGEQLSRQIAELESQRSAVLAQYKEAKQPIDEKNIEKLELEIVDIEKRIKTAEEAANNKKLLYDAGAVSQEEYQSALRNLEGEKSSLEKAKLDLELMRKPVSENIDVQYKAQLKQLDIQKAELEKSGKNFTIIASMDGTILQKEVEKGSYLQPGMHIMQLGNVEELYIESDVLVGDVANVYEGSVVKMSNKNLGIMDLEGVIKKIHPNAFSKVSDLGIEQKRIKVDIEIKDTIKNLRPGYDLDIKIITESKENVLLVPESSLFNIDGKDFIFVNENNKARLREVEKGIESQRQVEVVKGLKEGEMVLLSPNENIEEGISIKVE